MEFQSTKAHHVIDMVFANALPEHQEGMQKNPFGN